MCLLLQLHTKQVKCEVAKFVFVVEIPSLDSHPTKRISLHNVYRVGNIVFQLCGFKGYNFSHKFILIILQLTQNLCSK